MDTGSYKYEDLYKKYDGFSAPGYAVYIAGKKIDTKKSFISSIEVELNATGAAGGCTFTIQGKYDFAGQDWVNVMEDSLEVGAKLQIDGGYVTQEEIFYGYVDDYSMRFPRKDAPLIQVNGLDAMGFLMCFNEPIYGAKKDPQSVVTEILDKAVNAGYAKGKDIGSLEGFQTPVIKKGVDDWKFLNTLAQRYGAQMAVIDGEIVFKNLASDTTPVVSLAMGRNLISFERKLSMAHQVGKVEVWGRDKNQGFLKGVATECSIGGKGSTAIELAPKFAKAGIREYSEYGRTQEECDALAQARLDGIAMGLVYGKGMCVGLPELIPGRYVEIENADKRLNGTYFITKVKHIFSGDGYVSQFEVKGARA